MGGMGGGGMFQVAPPQQGLNNAAVEALKKKLRVAR